MILTEKNHPGRGPEGITTLSVKHELFVRSLIIHQGNQARAYLEVYKSCSVTSAPSKASRLVRNGNVFGRIRELSTGESPLMHMAYREIVRGLNAKKAVRCNGRLLFSPDNWSRLRAAVLGLKLMGHL